MLYLLLGSAIFIINNVAWLFFLYKRLDAQDIKEQILTNKIQHPEIMHPVSVGRKKGKAPLEETPPSFVGAFADPEYEAVGEINPEWIERSRGSNGG